MGRTKYDINIKKNPFVTGHFLVRFTNEDALNCFNKTNPEFSHKFKAAHINEWFPMTNKTYKWLIEYEGFKCFTLNMVK